MNAEACDMAVALARNLGFAVFPCGDDKAPACPHGFKDACSDPDGVDRLWSMHPGPLVGIATGAVSGMSALDVDVKHDEAIAWWWRKEQQLPATRMYRTRSGGMHLWFRHAAGVRNSTAKICLGIDTRGDGGYVIFWFATGLECLDPAPLAPWPDWLSRLIWPPAPPQRRQWRSNDAMTPGAGIKGLIEAVAHATEGNRNSILNWAAWKMQDQIVRGVIGENEAHQELLNAAMGAGLPAREAIATLRSAFGRGGSHESKS